MKPTGRGLLIVALIILVALLAFAAGWAFQGYLKPEAAIDLLNQRFFCS